MKRPDPAIARRRMRAPVAAATSDAMRLEKLGVARFDLRDPYHFALTLTWPEFFVGLVVAYIAINVLFALAYFAVPASIANLPADSLLDAFFFSVETLATVGYGTMVPASRYGHFVATAEIFVGMLFSATMTGLLFVRFSKPKAKLAFADRPVVTHTDEGLMLMIRVGNARLDALMDATARLTILRPEIGPDGQRFRRALDLQLGRPDLPFFPLTWTVMHRIDATSPLAAADGTLVALDDVRMMLAITARDPGLGASVHAARAYRGVDIAVGMRYADAVTWDDIGGSVADLRKISGIEPEAAPRAGRSP